MAGLGIAPAEPISDFVERHNESFNPFVWRADPNDIIAAAKRGHQALQTTR